MADGHHRRVAVALRNPGTVASKQTAFTTSSVFLRSIVPAFYRDDGHRGATTEVSAGVGL